MRDRSLVYDTPSYPLLFEAARIRPTWACRGEFFSLGCSWNSSTGIHLTAAISLSWAVSSKVVGIILTTNHRSLVPKLKPCEWRNISMESTFASTPVSSLTSLIAASPRSSPELMSPVGTFQKSMPPTGPDFSWTTSISLLSFSTKAPTPTWWEGPCGRVQGVEGSHLVSMAAPGEAWWKSNPRDTATGTRWDWAVGIFSQTPLLLQVCQVSRLLSSSAPKASAEKFVMLFGSIITPPYVSSLKNIVISSASTEEFMVQRAESVRLVQICLQQFRCLWQWPKLIALRR
mmetsp:Transcript_3627/g.5375  ORF Transcript_3627/g.5375 Transcript_3627/m.5375 type:complete len:288 (-) Transcript_3627:187-1050(-)